MNGHQEGAAEEGDDNSGGEDPTLEELIQGLNWYAYFQISQMQRRKRRDGHSLVFIEKLESEIRQTQVCIYRELSQPTIRQGDSATEQDSNSNDRFESFDRLSLQALS